MVSPNIDETPLKHEPPRGYAGRLARAKLAAVYAGDQRARATDSVILAADTVVCAGTRILPKAADEQQAQWCLDLLSGRRHRVVTCVVLGLPGGIRRERLVQSVVGFARLTEEQKGAYLASREWAGKAGGYAIQGLAACFIRFISGSYSNVVGLPLFETAQLLRGAGWRLP